MLTRSIPRWVKRLKTDPALAILIGCVPGKTPASTNHYVFINRCFPKNSSKDILPAHKNFTPSGKKPTKNQKLDTIPKNKVEDIVHNYHDGATDDYKMKYSFHLYIDCCLFSRSFSY